MERMLLVITVYNCEGRIIKLLRQLDDSVLKHFEEVLILNADSTDKTKEEIMEYKRKHPEKRIRLISSNKHSGLGTSVKYAFSYAIQKQYQWILVARGDGQITIRDFLPVLEQKMTRKYDAILGARFMKGSQLYHYSAKRIMANIGMNLVYSLICHQKIYDIGSGINLYSVKMLETKYYRKFPENNLFFALMLLSEKVRRHNIIFYPISTKEDGKLFPIKIMNQSLFLLEWAIRFLVCKNPLEGEYRRKCKIIQHKREPEVT